MSRRDQQGAGQSICSNNRAVATSSERNGAGTNHPVSDRARTDGEQSFPKPLVMPTELPDSKRQ